MKREVHIHIFINDEEIGQSGNEMVNDGTTQLHPRLDTKLDAPPTHHYITLRKDDTAPEHKLDDILAHELGHSIQRIFNTKANQDDIRQRMDSRMFASLSAISTPPKYITDGIIANETEAWDYARKMIPIDEELAKRDLDTYKEGNE